MDNLFAALTVPSKSEQFIKPQDGKPFRFRVMSEPISGFLAFDINKKPHRFQVAPPKKVLESLEVSEEAKFFVAFVIYHYETESFKVYELTQKTLIQSIKELASNPDYGNPIGYDLTVNRTGSNLNTKYTLVPSPPKPMAKEIQERFAELKYDMTALFRGGYPFE